MKRTISHFALMAFLLSPLAFAGDKNKSTSAPDDAQTASNASSNNPCVSGENKKKDKNKAKPAPSDQEEQFNKVLQGIYG